MVKLDNKRLYIKKRILLKIETMKKDIYPFILNYLFSSLLLQLHNNNLKYVFKVNFVSESIRMKVNGSNVICVAKSSKDEDTQKEIDRILNWLKQFDLPFCYFIGVSANNKLEITFFVTEEVYKKKEELDFKGNISNFIEFDDYYKEAILLSTLHKYYNYINFFGDSNIIISYIRGSIYFYKFSFNHPYESYIRELNTKNYSKGEIAFFESYIKTNSSYLFDMSPKDVKHWLINVSHQRIINDFLKPLNKSDTLDWMAQYPYFFYTDFSLSLRDTLKELNDANSLNKSLLDSEYLIDCLRYYLLLLFFTDEILKTNKLQSLFNKYSKTIFYEALINIDYEILVRKILDCMFKCYQDNKPITIQQFKYYLIDIVSNIEVVLNDSIKLNIKLNKLYWKNKLGLLIFLIINNILSEANICKFRLEEEYKFTSEEINNLLDEFHKISLSKDLKKVVKKLEKAVNLNNLNKSNDIEASNDACLELLSNSPVESVEYLIELHQLFNFERLYKNPII